MYTDFSLWQVTPKEEIICAFNELKSARIFAEKISRKKSNIRFDLRVKNDVGEQNLAIYLGGELVGLDEIGSFETKVGD